MSKIKELNYGCYETSKFRFSLFYYDGSLYNSKDGYQKLYDEGEYFNIGNYKYPNVSESQMIEWCEKAAKAGVKSSGLVDFLNDEYNAFFKNGKYSEENENESLDLHEDSLLEEDESVEDKDSNQSFDQISYEILEAFSGFMERKESKFLQNEDLNKDIDEYLTLISYSHLENKEGYKSKEDIKKYLFEEYKK